MGSLVFILLSWISLATSLAVAGNGKRVAIVGSGNWGSAIARTVATNVANLDGYVDEVKMWVYEEEIEGRKLTEIINEDHENVKYLPGIKLPRTVRACPDLLDGCADADVLVFVVPHQFLPHVLNDLKGHVKGGAIAVSLIKGLEVGANGPQLLSSMIQDALGLPPVAVLMGANVANDVVKDDFVEATLACRDAHVSQSLKPIFDSSSFRIQTATDVASVELCGAVKNVIAMGGGFCDGLDLGTSTKAAILRLGLQEMARLCKKFSPDFCMDLMMESCGVGDLIATSFGGRNRRCSSEYARRKCETGSADWVEIEKEMLNGQKLQGLGTLDEVVACLDHLGWRDEFPLIYRIHGIARQGLDPKTIVKW